MQLLARFDGGEGRIEPDVGPVRSDVPVAVTLQADTVYTLRVTAPDGVEAMRALSVPVTLALAWDFDTVPADWSVFPSQISDGLLRLRAEQLEDCGHDSASVAPADAKLMASGYERVAFEIDIADIRIGGGGTYAFIASYGGMIVQYQPGGPVAARRVRIVFDAVAGTVTATHDDDPPEALQWRAEAKEPGLKIVVDACAADLAATIALDIGSVAISGR